MIAPSESNDDVLVNCAEVTKNFQAGTQIVRALRGIDMTIRSGKLTLLVGPSGCGKTTLISVIAGIMTPTTGRCETLGVDFTKLSSNARAKLRLQAVFKVDFGGTLPRLYVGQQLDVFAATEP